MLVDDLAIASAIRRYEERLARDPASLVWAQLADLYRKAGRPRDAISTCREGLARFPHYTTARVILAKALSDDGELEPAIAEVQRVLEVQPNDVQCHRLIADLYRRHGDIDTAIEHLETVVTLDPGDRESLALLGLLRPDMPAGELTGLARVLRDDTFVTVTFGTVCLQQGCIEEAVTVFTRLLRKDPSHIRAREGLEQALRARSRRKG